MTPLNTIIEEEIERLRDLYLSESPDEDGAVTTSTTFSWATFDVTQKQEKIAYYLMTQEGIEDSFTTAIQRACEARRNDTIDTINAIANNVVSTCGTVDDLRRYLIEAIKK